MPNTAELTVSELLERLDTGEIPMTARVLVTLEDGPIRPKTDDLTMALFAQWDTEDKLSSEEHRNADDKIYAEIERFGIPRLKI